MSTTEQRLTANRANALKSTGPATVAGKAAASRNSTRHGLLSSNLFLDDESAADFDALLLELQSALNPVGGIELTLVERIAIAIWRQRRLVTAEAAAIALNRDLRKVVSDVNCAMALGFGSELKADDLQPFDPAQVAFCTRSIAEAAKLEQIDLAGLQTLAPTIYQQLVSDAEEDGEDVETHSRTHEGGLTGYIGELVAWCHTELRTAEQRPHVLALTNQVRARRLILPDGTIEIMSRYQTMLDNQLYKALRALREAQEWRLKTLDGAVPSDPATAHKAA
jgi:hypothetical protein